MSNPHKFRLGIQQAQRLTLPPECEYFGEEQGYPFWHVLVDDELVSTIVQPFESSDIFVELFGNPIQHIWGDGNGMVSVRLISNYILWTRPIGLERYNLSIVPDPASWSAIKRDHIYLFDAGDYVSLVNQQPKTAPLTQIQKTSRQIYKKYEEHYYEALNTTVHKSLPPLLTANDLRELIVLETGRVFLKLPITEQDCKKSINISNAGNRLSETLIDAINSYSAVQTVEAPHKWITFQIIYNSSKSNNGPCILHVGRTAQGNIAVLFKTNPCFPIWLTGSEFDTVFDNEEAVKRLSP